ncbi:DUF192 domain-containing protein [Wenzhouxiangella sp. AB-CW3]|uniref:DUF192 domain-containing protein n=1 Tax=Wenzhouxiangella sp. AB-CW3 TaxID=2771012 RepID=UPI00168BBBDA|nr:DUF192 domain-containing protein [Wenzhouxiangella sp. AB-CW3]QOC22590.1 DUF192 domain-containing protein [Wenzhouxiangella sp. AB-CW3]
MRPIILKLLVATITVAALVACHANEPWVEVKGKRFYVEIADDDESRARGLMFRDELADNRGMLFIFRQEAPRSFWMRNTRIPLDIIYLDRDLRVVSIVHNARPCRTRSGRCPSYPSEGPAMYVLEVNAGFARSLELQRGDQLSAGNVPHLE